MVHNRMATLKKQNILYYAYCYLMTSSISTLMDLWNTEEVNE